MCRGTTVEVIAITIILTEWVEFKHLNTNLQIKQKKRISWELSIFLGQFGERLKRLTTVELSSLQYYEK